MPWEYTWYLINPAHIFLKFSHILCMSAMTLSQICINQNIEPVGQREKCVTNFRSNIKQNREQPK